MKNKQDAIKGVKWTVIANGSRQIVSFGVFWLLARLLSPDVFGLVALASVYISFLELFVSQGLGMAIIQKKDLKDEHIDTAFWTSVFSGVVLFILTIVLSRPIAYLMGEIKLQPLLAVMATGFIMISLSNIQSSILTRELKFKELAMRQVFGLIGGGVVGVVMALNQFGAWSLVGQQLTRSAINVATIWKVSTWRPQFRYSRVYLKDLMSFSWAVFLSRLFTFFSSRGDQFVIGKVLGSSQLGFYSVGQKLIQLLNLGIANPITSVALPLLSRIQDDAQKMTKSIYNGIEIVALFSWPVYTLLLCTAPDVVQILFGEKWLQAGNIVRVLIAGEIVRSLAVFSYPTFIAGGKPYFSMWVTGIKSVCIIGAALAGLKWGLLGVAWGVNATVLFSTFFSIAMMKKILPIRKSKIFKAISIPAVCSVVAAAGMIILECYYPKEFDVKLRIVFSIMVLMLLYIVALRLVSSRLYNSAMDYIQRLYKRNNKKGL